MRRRFEKIWRSRETCFILGGDGVLYARGSNGIGALGMGDKESRAFFSPVPSMLGYQVKEIWLSNRNTFALTDRGVFACGSNSNGNLGIGAGVKSEVVEFTRVSSLDGVDVMSMWLGGMTSFAFDGLRLFACGRNDRGALGLRGGSRFLFEEVALFHGLSVRKVWSEFGKTFVLLEDGRLFAAGWCGDELDGGYGTGLTVKFKERDQFKEVPLPSAVRVGDMSLGNLASFIVTEDGKLFVSGDNRTLALGLSHDVDKVYGFRMVDLPVKRKKAEKVWTGEGSTFVELEGGVLLGCGYNCAGQLGFRSEETDFVDMQVVSKSVGGQIHDIDISRSRTHLYVGDYVYVGGKGEGRRDPQVLGGTSFVRYLPKDLSNFSLSGKLGYFAKVGNVVSLLSVFYDCLGLIAPYIEGSPIFEEGRGVYGKKV